MHHKSNASATAERTLCHNCTATTTDTKMKRNRRVLKCNFQVALCMIFMCCSSVVLSQSINNVNSKQSQHAVHTNKKSSNTLAPLSPDAVLTAFNSDDDDDEDEEEDKSDDEYSNENEFGSSGSDLIISENPVGGELDDLQKNGLPFFFKEPENQYIVKKKPAVLKCITTHALEVIFLVRLSHLIIAIRCYEKIEREREIEDEN